MRTKSTPFKVINETTKMKTRSSKMQKTKKGAKDKAVKKAKPLISLKDNNSFRQLLLTVKPCSVVLTRCDDARFQNTSFPSEISKMDFEVCSIKTEIPEDAEEQARGVNLRKRVSKRLIQFNKEKIAKELPSNNFPTSVVSNIPKKQIKIEVLNTTDSSCNIQEQTHNQVQKTHSKQAITSTAHRKKPMTFAANSKKAMTSIAYTEMRLVDGVWRSKSPDVVQHTKESSSKDDVKPDSVIQETGSSPFEHLIHNYAKPTDDELSKTQMENVFPDSLITSDGKTPLVENRNENLPFSKICEVCGKDFEIKSILKRKILEPSPQMPNVPGLLGPRDFSFLTFVCPPIKGFLSDITQNGKYVHCARCPMMYLKLDNLKNHKQIHSFPYKISRICKYCFQIFNSKGATKRHEERFHAVSATTCRPFSSQLPERVAENVTSSNNTLTSLYKDLEEVVPIFSSNLKCPNQFFINVPNIMFFGLGTGVKMVIDGSYSSYFVNMKESDNERNFVTPCSENLDNFEYQSQENTKCTHSYPTEEHNYCFIPPACLDSDDTRIECGITDAVLSSEKDRDPVYNNVVSHYLDDNGFNSDNLVPDISHVEEIGGENAENEDMCISLSPDIVKYISQGFSEEHQISNGREQKYLEPRILEMKAPVQSGQTIANSRLHQNTTHGGINGIGLCLLNGLTVNTNFVRDQPGKVIYKSLLCRKVGDQKISTVQLHCTSPGSNKGCNGKVAVCRLMYRCKLCQKTFTNKTDLGKHMSNHLRWFCSPCFKVFHTNNEFQVHKEQVHGESNGSAPHLSNQVTTKEQTFVNIKNSVHTKPPNTVSGNKLRCDDKTAGKTVQVSVTSKRNATSVKSLNKNLGGPVSKTLRSTNSDKSKFDSTSGIHTKDLVQRGAVTEDRCRSDIPKIDSKTQPTPESHQVSERFFDEPCFLSSQLPGFTDLNFDCNNLDLDDSHQKKQILPIFDVSAKLPSTDFPKECTLQAKSKISNEDMFLADVKLMSHDHLAVTDIKNITKGIVEDLISIC